MSTKISDAAVHAVAVKIVRWGIDEARERDAMYEEATALLLDADPDFTDAENEALSVRIERAIADLISVRPDAPVAAGATVTREQVEALRRVIAEAPGPLPGTPHGIWKREVEDTTARALTALGLTVVDGSTEGDR